MPPPVQTVELTSVTDPVSLLRALRREASPGLMLDGADSGRFGWSVGPLVAVRPRLGFTWDGSGLDEPRDPIAALDGLARRRRLRGGEPETGVVVLLSYDLIAPPKRARRTEPGLPGMVVLEVDRSVRFFPDAPARFTIASSDGRSADLEPDRWLDVLDSLSSAREDSVTSARAIGRPRTSLPRDEYLDAVERIRHFIRVGDVYQANLCQRFAVDYTGDELGFYSKLRDVARAPMGAFVEAAGLTVASVSPEVFVRGTATRIETFPIKGTRARGGSVVEDRRAADELLASSKDRAELVMIVDLERNDLGRVCRTGSVHTPEVVALQTFPTVHHLVGRVTGDLDEGISIGDILRATFPGGSITGAPKLRAMEILADLEPVPRTFFTGSLLWLGDDGSFDSSILIRTLVGSRGRAWIGAGGGIVTDSVPEAEWHESNLKARALTEGLGFDPEEAR